MPLPSQKQKFYKTWSHSYPFAVLEIAVSIQNAQNLIANLILGDQQLYVCLIYFLLFVIKAILQFK